MAIMLTEDEVARLKMVDSAIFTTLVHSLPLELFRKIQMETFSINPSMTPCEVDSNYAPPNLLQVNTATREQFAQAYYSETTFEFRNTQLCITWLETLSVNHRHLLERVRLIHAQKICDHCELWSKAWSMKAATRSIRVETKPGLIEGVYYIYFKESPKHKQIERDLVSLHD